IGPAVIGWLKSKQPGGQPIRSDGPETHLKKKGTPTMGGLMILFSVTISTLIWVDIANPYTWIVLWVCLGFGAIGFADDYAKPTKRRQDGVPGKLRLFLEAVIGLIAVLSTMVLTTGELSTSRAFPFFKDLFVNHGWFFV